MRSGWRAVRLSVAVLVVVVVVGGCGGSPDLGDVLKPESSWQGDVPGEAQMLEPAEFHRRVKAGTLVITLISDGDDQAQALDEAFLADLAVLQAVADPSPALSDLLEAVEDASAYEPGTTVEVGGEEVTLLGLGERVRDAAVIQQRASDPDNALADYRMSFDLLPDELKSQATPPEDLEGAGLEELRAALAALDALLATVEDLDRVRYDPDWLAGGLDPAQKVPGSDHDATCAQPTGYFANYWFPLRNFLSPVKNQARRYDCWAFASIGAIESRERVQNDNSVDLSEQFYVNQAKFVWDRNDYTESHSASLALSRAVAANQRLPDESYWLYNPATGRAGSLDGDMAQYAGTCDAYQGSCSATAHQTPIFCTLHAVNGTVLPFCAYAQVNYSGAGVLASSSRQVWSSGQAFDLNRYRQYLAQGHVIIASYPVYRGFNEAVGGTTPRCAATAPAARRRSAAATSCRSWASSATRRSPPSSSPSTPAVAATSWSRTPGAASPATAATTTCRPTTWSRCSARSKCWSSTRGAAPAGTRSSRRRAAPRRPPSRSTPCRCRGAPTCA